MAYGKYETLLLNPNIQAFLQVIRKGEGTLGAGGYTILFGGTHFSSFVAHPNILITKSGYSSTAAGAYQFLSKTWRGVQSSIGLPDFSPHSQDVGAVYQLAARGAIKDIVNGNITLAIKKCSPEWASLPFSKYGQPTQKLSTALAFYKAQGGVMSPTDQQTGAVYVNQPMSEGENTTETNDGLNGSDFNFQTIQNNIEVLEADNTFGIPWGGRSTLEEESGYIGLKQYLLYLTTRYYPQNLIPFVELIPVFSIDKAEPISSANVSTAKTFFGGKFPGMSEALDVALKDKIVDGNDFESNTTLLDIERFNKTADKMKELAANGGADLFRLDPFRETTDAFNTPNADGQAIQDARGFGYKIFGNLTFNPSIQGGELSKAGAVGLKSIDIELGSQTHFGMSLITVKFVDVQGNKFIDINSPWSFILKSRPGMQGSDFYFRYGWQINIPDAKRMDDEQAKRYWSHPGWATFAALKVGSGENSDEGFAIKKFIQDQAAKGGNTLTLSQSNSLNSMTTPNYMLDKTTNEFTVQTDFLNPLDYDTLTMINPELNVDSSTGSIEATLYFRSNCGVANCLALLNGSGLTNFRCKALANSGDTDLATLMSAFVKDNQDYILNNSILSNIPKNSPSNKVFLADFEIKDWLTVIGGAGSESLLDADPSTIKIHFTDKSKNQINTATPEHTGLLLQWLSYTLNDNYCSLVVAGGNKSESAATAYSQIPGGFVIAYDSDAAGVKTQVKDAVEDLARRDSTFADYRQYIDSNETDNFVGKRLTVQDDVFAFRFSGSLIETMTVDKMQNNTQTVLDSQKSFANEQGESENSTEVGIGTENQAISPPPSKGVTLSNKKTALKIMYSEMAGLKVDAICHPWIKLCRPIFVKGMGFFDGKYMVTKCTHKLNDDNKFTSNISACRILNNGAVQKAQDNLEGYQTTSMNKPGINKASNVGLTRKQNTSSNPFSPEFQEVNYPGFPGAPVNTNISVDPKVLLRPSLEAFIKDLHYSAQNTFREFIRIFEASSPYKVYITSGFRSFPEQAAQKRANPSNNASPGYSMHNYGLAIDINLMLNGTIVVLKDTNSSVWINSGIVSLAKRLGLTWGGDSFGNYKDRVHFGYDKTFNGATLLAIAKNQFGTNINSIVGNKVDLSGKSARRG